MDFISEKALRILQNIYSFDKINRRLLPLDEEYRPEEEYNYFKIKDYFIYVNDENLQKLVELSVFMRKKAEEEKKYGNNINSLVKYSNIGNYTDASGPIDFESSLSKIIHADNIQFEYEDTQGIKSYGYDSDRNSKYTGFVLIEGIKRDGSNYQVKIDIIKFCINVFVYTADRYSMM